MGTRIIYLTSKHNIQFKGSGAELCRRVQNLLNVSRNQSNRLGGGSIYLPGSTKIHEQSLTDMQEVLTFNCFWMWFSLFHSFI